MPRRAGDPRAAPGARGPRPVRPAGRLAVEFANSVACAACRSDDALASVARFHIWARPRFPGLAAREEDDDLRRLRRFRTSVRELLEATVQRRRAGAGALQRVNAALLPGPGALRLAQRGATWVAAPLPPPGERRRYVETTIAYAASALLTAPTGPRLVACHGAGCRHFVLARTRTQLWCSPLGCGNRARVARHYRKSMRRRSRASPAPRRSQPAARAPASRRTAKR